MSKFKEHDLIEIATQPKYHPDEDLVGSKGYVAEADNDFCEVVILLADGKVVGRGVVEQTVLKSCRDEWLVKAKLLHEIDVLREAVGVYEELDELPEVMKGNKVKCPFCGMRHELEKPTNRQGQQIGEIMFFYCGKKAYIGSIDDHRITRVLRRKLA